MKYYKLILCAMLFPLLVSSCMAGMTFSESLSSVRVGMSQAEVVQRFGNPKFRRFNNQHEEWEYERCNTLMGSNYAMVLTFENGLLLTFNSFEKVSIATQPPATQPNVPPTYLPNGIRIMNNDEFNDFYRAVTRSPFQSDQMRLIEDTGKYRAFTCDQIVRLVRIFTFDHEKLKVVRAIAPNVVDPYNKYKVMDELNFSSSKEVVNKLIH